VELLDYVIERLNNKGLSKVWESTTKTEILEVNIYKESD
jgi:hypothetical protein